MDKKTFTIPHLRPVVTVNPRNVDPVKGLYCPALKIDQPEMSSRSDVSSRPPIEPASAPRFPLCPQLGRIPLLTPTCWSTVHRRALFPFTPKWIFLHWTNRLIE